MNKKQIKTIMEIARILAPKYTFGYYTTKDIEQEAFLIGMELLNKNPDIFDKKKSSFKTFLYTHINNRLKSFKRDNYHRLVDSPINETKKNLMNPITLDNIPVTDYKTNDPFFYVELDEIKSLINKYLPIHLREDYLKLLDGVDIPPQRKKKVETVITEIWENYKGEEHTSG